LLAFLGKVSIMRMVICAPIEKKAELVKLLEADPYNPVSFSRAGYKVKDGALCGLDKDKVYVHFSGSDEDVKKLVEIAKPLAAEAPAPQKEAFMKFIDDEDSSAQQGFGAIFG